MDLKLSDLVVGEELTARAMLSAGGRISLYEGPRPEKVDAPVGTAKLLGKSEPLQIVPAGKRLFRIRCAFWDILQRGVASWYRAHDREGRALFDGSLPKGTFTDDSTGAKLPENIMWPGLTLNIEITQEVE